MSTKLCRNITLKCHVSTYQCKRLGTYAEKAQLLQSIPSTKAHAATTIIAEIGTGMPRFPSAKHLASWAGVALGKKQSAGKRLGNKITKGNPYLRAVLAKVVWSIRRTKTYLAAQYHRFARRKGKRRAVMAVAHSIVTIIYYVLKEKKPYKELGEDYLTAWISSKFNTIMYTV